MQKPQRQDAAIIPTVSHPPKALSVRLATISRSMVILAVIAVAAVCYIARDILAPIMLALLFSLLLSPLAGALERFRMPRALASGLVVLALIGIAGAGIVALAQPAREWIAKAPSAMHLVEDRMRQWRGPVQEAKKATETLQSLTQSGSPQAQVEGVE